MLASDKTTLTQHQGNKNCYAVYLSSANVDKSVRSKGSARCWFMVGQIPVAKWHEEKDATILTRRLYHVCMDIITKNLKAASRVPVMMVDARGRWRKVRTILFVHLADLPEQHVIAGTTTSGAPSSLAVFNNFGRRRAHRLRHGSHTMGLISHIIRVKRIRPDNLTKFRNATKILHLNGVHKPFWRDWRFADPCQFLAPDALHQWHKFFWAHPVKWAKLLMGNAEIDRRFASLQKVVGKRQFPDGFSHFGGQITMREQRDIASHLLSILPGCEFISTGCLRAFRALLGLLLPSAV